MSEAEEYINQIEKNLDFENSEPYKNIEDLGISIQCKEDAVTSNDVKITITVSGKINGAVVSDAKTTISAPIRVISAADIKAELESYLDLDAISVTSDTVDDKLKERIENEVSSAIEQMDLKGYVGLNDSQKDFKVSVDLENGKEDTEFNTKSWDCDITITNNQYAKDKTATAIEKTFTTDLTTVSNDADKAFDYLEDNLKEVTVPAEIDTTINGDADAKKLIDAIEKAMNETFEGSEYDSLGSKAASATVITSAENIEDMTYIAPQMVANGKWKGIVKVYVNDKAEYRSISFTLKKEATEENTVVKMELSEAKEDVEINTALGNAVKGIVLYFEDGSKKTIEAKDFENNDYFTYDKFSWDASKLGQTSVTFVTKSAATPVTLEYTANVVSTVTYTEDNTTDGKGLGMNFYDVFDISTENLESISSSDESVLKVSFDKKDQEIKIIGYKKGSAVITVVGTAGRVVNTTVQVSDGGKFKAGTSMEDTRTRYVTGKEIGFEVHESNSKNSVKVTNVEPANWQNDTVVEAEITAIGDQGVIAITPVAEGEATIVITGGDNGKLKIQFNVTITKDPDSGALVLDTDIDEDLYKTFTLEAGKSTKEKIQNLNITGEDILDVSDLGFSSSDKISVSYELKKDGKEYKDTIPAEDATGVKVVVNADGVLEGIQLEYYGKYTKTIPLKDDGSAYIANAVTDLGLVAETVEKIENDPAADDLLEDVEFTTDASGNPIILFKPADGVSGTATVTVADALGNTAVLKVKVEDGKIAKNGIKVTDKFELAGDWELVQSTKPTYTIGDSFDAKGAYLKSEDAAGKEVKIELTEDMLEEFSTDISYVDGTGKLTVQTAAIKYGNVENGVLNFEYYVKPASKTISVDSLGFDSDEKVVSTTNRGDSSISSSLNEEKDTVTIIAGEVEKNGAVIVATNTGREVSIKVTVDENGDIETSVSEKFEPSITTVENTEKVLGVIGTEASSSNEEIALVSIAGNKVVITSVAPGSATITVNDDEKMAKIPVTVDEFGTITVGNILKANSTGFVRGDIITEGTYAGQYNWYYYVDGELITNDWEEVDENGTKVWYHFGKDGKMDRGWIIDESGWKVYYLDANGRMYHDTWANAEENEALNMPAGMYYLQSDGAVQMNGWAPAPGSENVWWFCAAGNGLFVNIPSNWSSVKLK